MLRKFIFVRKTTRRIRAASGRIDKIWVLFLVLFLSCQRHHKSEQEKVSYDLEVDLKIDEYRCRKEYDFARLYLYAIYYKGYCLGSICDRVDKTKYIASNGYRRIATTNIRLDIAKDSAIKENGDTLIFRIFAFSNDSFNCKCHYGYQYMLPAGVSIVRGDEHIIDATDYYGLIWRPTEQSVTKTISDSNMLNFVKRNKDIINPWFYRELVNRRLLKE